METLKTLRDRFNSCRSSLKGFDHDLTEVGETLMKLSEKRNKLIAELSEIDETIENINKSSVELRSSHTYYQKLLSKYRDQIEDFKVKQGFSRGNCKRVQRMTHRGNFDKIYDSLEEAAKDNGITRTTVRKSCNGGIIQNQYDFRFLE